VRFGKWDEVLAEPRPTSGQPFATAMSHYARGLALAAKKDVKAAEAELAALSSIAADEKTRALQSDVLPGATLVEIARHDLAGHVALAKGETDKGLAELREAVKVEDGLPYMEPPFSYVPLRHGLGAALVAAGKGAEAEAVYREDLKRNPHNGWALFGLARSLEAQRKPELAAEVMRQFELAWVRADIRPTSSRH
jgi:tetratricopeptide (TPR) repeat protein